jgi:hypothetical protein
MAGINLTKRRCTLIVSNDAARCGCWWWAPSPSRDLPGGRAVGVTWNADCHAAWRAAIQAVISEARQAMQRVESFTGGGRRPLST